MTDNEERIKQEVRQEMLFFCNNCNKQLFQVWNIATYKNEYYDDGDRVNLHYCKEKLKKAKGIHQPCQQEVYTAMEKIEGKYPIFDDEEGKTIHNCPKKQHVEEYQHKIMSEVPVKCNKCEEDIYPVWEKETGELLTFMEKDEKITKIHYCVKKYSNKRSKEEVEKIMGDIIKFAIYLVKTNKDYSRLSEQEIERAMTVLIQSQVELYK